MNAFSVVIGRFQPAHQAHLAMIRRALEISNKVIILVGSTDAPRTTRNPFTFEERETLLRSLLKDVDKNRYVIRPVPDAFQSDVTWVASVQSEVRAITKGTEDVILVGNFKDSSSYYLKLFPTWDFHDTGIQDGVSATSIRNAWFSGENYPTGTPQETVAFLASFDENTFHVLEEEFLFVREYKKLWAEAPYPVNFVTTDAVVLRSGHVLLVRRKDAPGKGLYALPGGFVGTDETVKEAAIREVYEETSIRLLKEILSDKLAETRVFDYPERDARGRVITHAHFFDLGNGVLPIVAGGSDASSAEWKPLAWVFGNPQLVYADHISIISAFVWR